MNANDYKPNSHRAKAEQSAEKKRAEKVIASHVKVKKKSEARKFADTFLAEDVSNVKNYILGDVIVPLIKKTICDIFADIPNMIFYGKPSGGRRPIDHVSYNRYSSSSSSRDYRSSRDERQPRIGFATDEQVFTNRGDAERVLAGMDDIMAEYGLVRVLDFYDLIGMSCDPTATRYGWMNIRTAEVQRVREGWIIRMPKAVPID